MLALMSVTNMGPNGEVVIPDEILDAVGLKVGDEVTIHAERGEAVVRKAPDPASPIDSR
jgi:bifunctional DNA-binding transcriptional regulator/antitoxin component of YhaV-PrlF toxin-antitoxin module